MYKNPIIVLPEQYGGATHPVIHEAVHFLQRNDWTMDWSYFKVRKFTNAGFKEFVSQQEETEAHFILILFIARYECNLVKPCELAQFRKRIFKVITQPHMRVNAICWAVRNNIFLNQQTKIKWFMVKNSNVYSQGSGGSLLVVGIYRLFECPT